MKTQTLVIGGLAVIAVAGVGYLALRSRAPAVVPAAPAPAAYVAAQGAPFAPKPAGGIDFNGAVKTVTDVVHAGQDVLKFFQGL